ncbi:MAG: hypothetical protein ACOYJL_01575 [Tractidigestivibacter sp.]|jgi:hypothetical protein
MGVVLPAGGGLLGLSTPAALFSAASSLLLPALRIVLGSCPLVADEGLRDGAVRRSLIVAAGLAVLTLAYIGSLARWMRDAYYLVLLVLFSVLMIGIVLALHYLYDVRWMVAVFAGTAGYTVQNLASGADEMASLLVSGHGVSGFGDPLYPVIFLAVTAIVYVPYRLLFVSAVRKAGVRTVRDRSLVLVMFFAMAVVIGFDLIIKNLTDTRAVGISMVALLRGVHGLACVFVLWLLYELLVRSGLAVDMAVQRRLLKERDRQFELSKRSIEVVNARLHDVRHSVLRLLDEAEPGIDRATLAEVGRQISVYDARVKTGNEALDTVLTEKRLACLQAGATLTCVADGSALSRMEPGEVYSLFDDLLTFALESGATSISLTVRESRGVTSIHLEKGGAPLGHSSPSLPSEVKRIAAAHDGSASFTNGCVDVILMGCASEQEARANRR